MALVSEKEADLYPVVERWMKRHFGCFKSAINLGTSHSRVDVLGVRDVGGDNSGEIELIAVEVKRGNEPFATASGQALGYKVLAHRVYLADVRAEPYSGDEMMIASHLGIGLVRITGKRCMEVLSSPYHLPVPKLSLSAIENMALGRCELCGCFVEIGQNRGKKFSGLSRENFAKAYKNEKGLMFWNYSVGSRKVRMNHPKAANGKIYERRFLCAECVQVFCQIKSILQES